MFIAVGPHETTQAVCSVEGNWIGGFQSMLSVGATCVNEIAVVGADSHNCLFQDGSIAHGFALPNPTGKVNDKREERRPVLLLWWA